MANEFGKVGLENVLRKAEKNHYMCIKSTIDAEQVPVIDGNLRARIGYTNKESASFLSAIGLWMVLRVSSILRKQDMFLLIA